MKLSEFPQKKVYSSQGECQGRVRVWHPLCLHGECEVCRENMLMWRIKKCFPSQTVRVGISPVRQWLRICLSMQGTWVWSLVREDSTCCWATKPMCHNYWVHMPTAHAPQREKPPQWETHAPQLERSPCLPQLEKACTQQWKSSTTKNKQKRERDREPELALHVLKSRAIQGCIWGHRKNVVGWGLNERGKFGGNLMLLNCGVGEDSWESLGLQGDPTSPFWRTSALGFLWKEWC